MASRAYSKRYAQAAFEIALEASELERWQTELENMARIVSDSELRAFLENPKVPIDEKTKLLTGQLKGVNPLVISMVFLLVSKRSIDMLGEIAEEYQRLWNHHRGIEVAEVTTAVPLTGEDEEKLAAHLGRIVGKKVEIRADVDPDVIGGFVARIGDRRVDGSIRSKLAMLKKEMAGKER